MYCRFQTFAADAQERYPEIQAVLKPLTKVSNLSVFLMFFKSASGAARTLPGGPGSTLVDFGSPRAPPEGPFWCHVAAALVPFPVF